MEFIVPGICGLLVIIGLVAIIMGRATWRIPMMILVFFIMVFSLTLFYLSAKVLQTRLNWEAALADYRTTIKGVKEGTPAQKGIEQLTKDRSQLQQQVAEAMAERGRVWPGAIKNKVDGATGQISATFDQWPPQGLEPKAVVFVFEDNEKEKGGQYLGEFTVLDVDAARKELKLAPSSTMVQRELNIIGTSKGPWTLYEVMPGDSHTMYAGLEPAALKNLLPKPPAPPAGEMDEETKKQYEMMKENYDKGIERFVRDQTAVTDADLKNDKTMENLKDGVRMLVKFTKGWPETAAAPAAPAAAAPAENPGNPADAAKPADDKSFKPGDVAYLSVEQAKDLVEVKKVAEYDTSDPAKARIYVRPLKDYARLFRETYRRRNELFALQAEIKAQADQVVAAGKQLDEDIAAAKTEKDGLTKDLTKFKKELDTVVAYNATLDDKLAKTRASLSELFRANLRLSAQLTDVEHQIVEAIHRQTPPAEASASVGH